MKKNKLNLIAVFLLLNCLLLSCTDFLDNPNNDNNSNNDTTLTLTGIVSTKTINVSGKPFSMLEWYAYIYRYGFNPNICYYANSDNSIDIAWLDPDAETITITSVDEYGNLINEFTLSNIPATDNLLGLTKITLDNSFVIGYSANEGYEFWVTRIDESGNEIFNKCIFTSEYNEVSYLSARFPNSSSRVMYNPTENKICIYLGHNHTFENDETHEGGWLGFLEIDGEIVLKQYSWGEYMLLGSSWYISHNLDQRLLIDDDKYVILGLGDGWPRALVFAIWNTNPDYDVNNEETRTEFFEIPGEYGDNVTNTQIGGIVKLSDGNYGICFSSLHTRERMDVCYMKISSSGSILEEQWLTSYTDVDAVFPRIANFDDNLVIGWQLFQENVDTFSDAHFIKIDEDGNTIENEFEAEGVNLQHQYDLINLPNGNVFWVEDTDENSLKLNWIKLDSF